ncbi:hypothetical protein [Flavobacterium segetis]|uniref:hypothetical protein n=1 Tax=Flavobacterium segetis TaxID=271157 RepID=UPI00093318D1|nr:hypothetical protein [Flavobacterium segetis]
MKIISIENNLVFPKYKQIIHLIEKAIEGENLKKEINYHQQTRYVKNSTYLETLCLKRMGN